jgi:methylisocitrate lyase
MVIWPVSALRVAAGAMAAVYADLTQAGTQAGWVDRMQTRRELYQLIRYHEYEAIDDSIARSVLPDEPTGERASERGGS